MKHVDIQDTVGQWQDDGQLADMDAIAFAFQRRCSAWLRAL
ncbi:hypothetical protein [Dyella sp.]